MKYYLIKFKRNWADEFDCEGFTIINEVNYNALDKLFKSEFGKTDGGFGFGTNEGWEDEFTYSKLWNDILKKQEISADQMQVIRETLLSIPKMSGVYYDTSYGIFPDFSYLGEDVEEGEYPELDEYWEQYNTGDFVL